MGANLVNCGNGCGNGRSISPASAWQAPDRRIINFHVAFVLSCHNTTTVDEMQTQQQQHVRAFSPHTSNMRAAWSRIFTSLSLIRILLLRELNAYARTALIKSHLGNSRNDAFHAFIGQ
jgi:hypothetical protein